MALDAGADHLGLIFTESPRRVTLDQARRIQDSLPPGAPLVGVFAAEPPEVVAPLQGALSLPAIQVAGWLEREVALPCEVWHVVRAASLPDPASLPMIPLRTYLLEPHDPALAGGTGRPADWDWARRAVEAGLRLVLAGGLSAVNVAQVVTEVRPYGVDASSRLERAPGLKDPARVRAFIARVREADHARPRLS